MSKPTPGELWKMPPDDFNQWRRENDLLKLFQCFQKCLPHFDEWLENNNLTIEFILGTDQPGQFFYWDNITYCFTRKKDEYTSYFFVPVQDAQHERSIEEAPGPVEEGVTLEHKKFIPYFLWVKQVYQLDKPVRGGYAGDLPTFRYVTGTAPDVPDMCQWVIAPGFQVLKLGGTEIESWASLLNRNLDFTNLDFLHIKGNFSFTRELSIFYAHCASLSADDVQAHFTQFYNCFFSKNEFKNSRLYGLEFYRCEMFFAYFENCSIVDMVIDNCSIINFSFNRVEVNAIHYSPPKTEWHNSLSRTYETIADNYKRFRILYQSNGLRHAVSRAYYLERLYELKFAWSETELVKSVKDLRKFGWKSGMVRLGNNIKKVFRPIPDTIGYLIWGFGERPLRILLFSLCLLTVYSVIYFFSTISALQHDFANSLYFSIVTFTTLGFGDITPQTHMDKLIVGSEALLGAFCIGLWVAGFANKSKY